MITADSPKHLTTLCIVMLLPFLVYIPSFWVPFYLDDFSSITENPALVNGDYSYYFHQYWRRIITYLTFFLDYKVWGDHFAGYHIWSTVLHAASTGVLFALSRRLFEILRVRHVTELALFTALLWALLPLNSQAVVYIVQRGALLATFFALLSTYLWVKAGTVERGQNRTYLLALVCLVPGVFAKEFVVVMPVIWFLLDVIVLKLAWQRIIKSYLSVALLMCAVLLTSYLLYDTNLIAEADRLTRENSRETRLEYFLAQPEIIAHYLYKVFWPSPLLLEYPYYQPGSWETAKPWLLMHGAIISVALLCVRKLPLFTFGILFYYLAHSIESGFIPITDFAFEHRTYLPNVGLILAIAALVSVVLKRFNGAKFVHIGGLIVLLLAAAFTLFRITQWVDPVDFYKRELQYTQNNPRLNYQLGAIYARDKDFASAEPYLKQAFVLGWKLQAMEIEYADGLLNLFLETGQTRNTEKLLQQLMASLTSKPRWQSRLLTSYSRMLVKNGQCDLAQPFLQKALTLHASNAKAQSLQLLCNKK